MQINKILKLSLGGLVAFPLSFFVGNDVLANHLTESFDYKLSNKNLLACGGASSGMNPAARAAKAEKKAKTKLMFKRRQLSKLAAAGESTAEVEAEIAELEAFLAK